MGNDDGGYYTRKSSILYIQLLALLGIHEQPSCRQTYIHVSIHTGEDELMPLAGFWGQRQAMCQQVPAHLLKGPCHTKRSASFSPDDDWHFQLEQLQGRSGGGESHHWPMYSLHSATIITVYLHNGG